MPNIFALHVALKPMWKTAYNIIVCITNTCEHVCDNIYGVYIISEAKSGITPAVLKPSREWFTEELNHPQ